jgi:TFIIF-interacting CTD phosphatase-like protein
MVKDLSLFCGERSNLSIDNLLLVDNMIYSFAFHLENGIPILDYEGDNRDSELLHLMNYLNKIKDCENIRRENEKVYKLN